MSDKINFYKEKKLLTPHELADLKHLTAIKAVGDFIITRGPLVSTQELGNVYKHLKGTKCLNKSVTLYKTFTKHLNLMQIYTWQSISA